MSHLTTGTLATTTALGVLAASLAFGGLEFGTASGHTDASSPPAIPRDLAWSVNRAGKADREVPGTAAAGGTTLTFQLVGVSGVSIATLTSSAEVARLRGGVSGHGAGQVKEPRPRAAISTAMFACEPLVSALTVVARQLAPGRCLA